MSGSLFRSHSKNEQNQIWFGPRHTRKPSNRYDVAFKRESTLVDLEREGPQETGVALQSENCSRRAPRPSSRYAHHDESSDFGELEHVLDASEE